MGLEVAVDPQPDAEQVTVDGRAIQVHRAPDGRWATPLLRYHRFTSLADLARVVATESPAFAERRQRTSV